MLFIHKKTKYVKAIDSIEEEILLGKEVSSEEDQNRLLKKIRVV